MKKLTALVLCLSMILAGFAFAEKETDIWALLEEAYIYAFPLVLMDATKTFATNTETVAAGKAPINQFMHGAGTANAKFKTVVTPNVDTVYTQVWLDLENEPVIYSMPAADRFFNAQLLDGWTNTVDVLTAPGVYAFTHADWKGELPEGMIRVNVPTQMAWFISRCLLLDENDLENVKAIQAGMDMRPLSAYISGEKYIPPMGTYIAENDFVPIQRVLSLSPFDFFVKANELMLKNPPANADAEKLARLASINVGPGLTFDARMLTGDAAAQWKAMLSELRAKLLAAGEKFSAAMGQWRYFGRPIGDFGTEYEYRAMIALGGLGANTPEVAMYAKTDTDETGALMNGAYRYRIHFETMPPVQGKGFWSVTAYGDDDFLIDNPLNRYAINDRSDFEMNEDGTLDIIVSAARPENISNWLPVNEDGFHLYMRIYTPDMDRIGTWAAPVITKIQSSAR